MLDRRHPADRFVDQPRDQIGIGLDLANCAGSCASAQIAPAVEDDVVSCPAVATIM